MKKGISKETAKIIINPIAKSIFKQYQNTWKQTSDRLLLMNTKWNIYAAKLSDIVNFLPKRFHKKALYSFLNVMRVTISLISIQNINNDCFISRFVMSIYKERLIQPRYDFT